LFVHGTDFKHCYYYRCYQVVNENNKPVIVGKTGTLKIDENSAAGTAIRGGTVDCTDTEVDVVCTPEKDTNCASGASTEVLCNAKSECDWVTDTCKCRRQKLEFFAKLNNPASTTAEGDPLPIIFTFKSGSNSDTPVFYDNGASPEVGDRVGATLYVKAGAAGLLDYEFYTSLDVSYGCRDNGFRDGATSGDPPVGWMESTPVDGSIQQVTITINDVNEAPFFTTIVDATSNRFELEVNENSDLLAITENFDPFVTCKDVDALTSGGAGDDSTKDATMELKTTSGGISTQFQIVKGDCTSGENLGQGLTCPSNGKRPWCVGAVIKPIGTVSGGGWLPDFEKQHQYNLTITATDIPGLFADLPIRITVRDRNDGPTIVRSASTSVSTWTVQEDAPAGFVVGRFNLTDPDIDGIIVTWRESTAPWDELQVTIESGNNGTAFELVVVSGTGTAGDPQIVELRYRGETSPPVAGASVWGLDYERQKQYVITVRVTDSGGPQKIQKTDAAPPLPAVEQRPAWVKSSLYEEITQIIDVIDVDDVTIDGVIVSTGTLATVGGDSVRIVGSNFGSTWAGSSAPNIVVTYTNPSAPADASGSDDPTSTGAGTAGINTVFTAVNCVRDNNVSTFVANTAIVCDSAPGFGDNQVWTVKITGDSVGEITSTASQQSSYQYPVITSVTTSGGTMNTLGNEDVLLTGTNMGPLGTQYWGDYGPSRLGGYGYCAGRTASTKGTGTWCRTTIANTQVTCTSAAGVGTSQSWRLQERKHPSWKTQDHSAVRNATTGTLDYTKPTITNIQLPPQAIAGGGLLTQGGESVTIAGTGFGSSNTNLFPCREEALPPNGNVYAPAGPQAPRARYGVQMEFPHRPEYSSINVVTECSEITAAGCGAKCTVQSDSQMICTTEPAVGANQSWTVLVAGQTSDPSLVHTSHRMPVVLKVYGEGLKNGPTTGGALVTVEGDQFGLVPPTVPGRDTDKIKRDGKYTYKVKANFGRWEGDEITGGWNTTIVPIFSSFPCTIISNNLLRCETKEGIGRNLSWTITVDAPMAQTSYPNHCEGSYAPPTLFTLTNNGGTDIQQGTSEGGNQIIIEGANFGPKGEDWNQPTLTYGKAVGDGETLQEFTAQNCTVTKAHKTIECETDEGAGFSHLWEVLVGGQLNTPATTGYAAPVIQNITGDGSSSADTSGNQWVWIHGLNFGPSSTSKRASFLETVTYGVSGTGEFFFDECLLCFFINT
jgi:hypothetical protein